MSIDPKTITFSTLQPSVLLAEATRQDSTTVNAKVVEKTGGFDTQGLDIEGLMMALGIERSNLIEGQVVDYANKMKDRNAEIKKVNDMVAQLRGDADKDSAPKYADTYDYLKGKGVDMSFDNGDDKCWGETERNTAIEYLKSQIDSLNSDSQQDMIKLQSLVNKRDQSYEMITNLIAKFSKTKDAVVGNLR